MAARGSRLTGLLKDHARGMAALLRGASWDLFEVACLAAFIAFIAEMNWAP